MGGGSPNAQVAATTPHGAVRPTQVRNGFAHSWRVTAWSWARRRRERGGCGTEVVTVSGHILTRDEPRPAPTESAHSAETPADRHALRFVPGLDGLRGVAVLAVMGFHAGLGPVNGGLLGVDMFFVLSGFLVTSLLLVEHARTGTIKLRGFWGRRARRLLPALLVLLIGIGAYARWVGGGVPPAQLRGDALFTLGYSANWHFIASGQNYFVQFGALSPLLHTWSLAVEEQFYLVWPVVVLVVLRRFGRRGVGWAAGVIGTASAALCAGLYLTGASIDRLYYGTDTRAQSIMVGAVLAVVVPMSARTVRPGAPSASSGLEAERRGPAWWYPTRRALHRRARPDRGVLSSLGLARRDGQRRAALRRRLPPRRPVHGGGDRLYRRTAACSPDQGTLLSPPALHRAYLLWALSVPLAPLPGPRRDQDRADGRGAPRGPGRGDLRGRRAVLPLRRIARPGVGTVRRASPRAPGRATLSAALLGLVVAGLLAATVTPGEAVLPIGSRPTAHFVGPGGVDAVHPEHALLLGDSIALTLGIGLGQHARAWGITLDNQGAWAATSTRRPPST